MLVPVTSVRYMARIPNSRDYIPDACLPILGLFIFTSNPPLENSGHISATSLSYISVVAYRDALRESVL